MREYRRYTESPQGFSIKDMKNCVVMFSWGSLISEMINKRLIDIWHKQDASEILGAENLFTNPTPTLKKLVLSRKGG